MQIQYVSYYFHSEVPKSTTICFTCLTCIYYRNKTKVNVRDIIYELQLHFKSEIYACFAVPCNPPSWE